MSQAKPASTALSYSDIFAEVASQESHAAAFKDVVRVLVLRNITVEGLDTYLKHQLYQRGIRAELAFGGYGAMVQDSLADDGLVATFGADLIVLAITLDELAPAYGAPGWRRDQAQADLMQLLELLTQRSRATIAVHTFITPSVRELGLVIDPHGHDLASQVSELNRAVIDFVRSHAPQCFLVDWDRELRRLGEDAALDRRGAYLWKSPFKRPFLQAWAKQLSNAVFALKGRSKKCLVLDCDNTLWGGVIGEDGLDGIQLDGHSYPGKAFVDFQTSVLHLVERGVLVTLCSKNNEADVFEVLDGHPWSRLKRSHLAGWRINWDDKASNIAALAVELNLGLDSFVFVDDNPVECGLVAQLLPRVTVIQVPKKLHELPSILLDSGLFDTLSLTTEDRQRATLYQSESQRKSAQGDFGSMDDYLRSLETVASIHPARAAELPRIAQLTQKTNQFNVTTRRYSEPEIEALVADPAADVYSLTVRDRYGPLGLVGALIVRRADGVANVDTFLMSCRALGRRLEQTMIEHCLAEVSSNQRLSHWRAEYRPSAKNAQVADFWPRVGFELTHEVDGHRHYEWRVGSPNAGPTPHVSIEKE